MLKSGYARILSGAQVNTIRILSIRTDSREAHLSRRPGTIGERTGRAPFKPLNFQPRI
jgi:hypothetical protein